MQHLKGNANNLLRRFKNLLGTSEADRSISDKELTKKLDDLMCEVEVQILQVRFTLALLESV